MHIVALTGSIGMGKSTAAAHLRDRGIAVFDADADVHRLYAGPLTDAIEAAFPGTRDADGRVDRVALGQQLIAQPQRYKDLEAIVHPAVRRDEEAFLRQQFAAGASIAVLEIPLLFESGADRLVDATIVVTAGTEEQRRRVLKRPGMTAERFESLLARQLDDGEKRKRADFVVDTSSAVEITRATLDKVIATVKTWPAQAYAAHWSAEAPQ